MKSSLSGKLGVLGAVTFAALASSNTIAAARKLDSTGRQRSIKHTMEEMEHQRRVAQDIAIARARVQADNSARHQHNKAIEDRKRERLYARVIRDYNARARGFADYKAQLKAEKILTGKG